MPPKVARELVATSGPKRKPCGLRKSLSWSRTTPAPTRTVRRSRFSAVIWRLWREKSTTTPAPTAPPASPVPAPRGMMSRPASAAARMMDGGLGGVAREGDGARLDLVEGGVGGVKLAGEVVESDITIRGGKGGVLLGRGHARIPGLQGLNPVSGLCYSCRL